MAADPYPRLIREHLQASRSQGIPFEQAWQQAMEDIGRRDVKLLGWRAGWPLADMKRIFERAYIGAHYRRDMTAVLEPPSCRPARERGTERPQPKRCLFGRPCPEPPAPGSRFCQTHSDLLQAIKLGKPRDFHIYGSGPKPIAA